MIRFPLIFVIVNITSCSLDNKTGIWQDISDLPAEKKNTKLIEDRNGESRYEDIIFKNNPYNQEKESLITTNAKSDISVKILNWHEEYALPTNNVSNFSYDENKILLSKSPKLSKFFTSEKNSNKNIIFHNNKLISYDHKGRIFIYDLELKKKIFEFNFYKKKFKKIQKKIRLIVNNDTLYAADNLGYLYALNLKSKSIVWAKNYGIPFRSNLKFSGNQIFLANQDNTIYSINKKNGEKNWQFATSTTYIKSDFRNNFVLDKINNSLFFLNTSGELYSINYLKQKVNWVLNFKSRSLTEDTNLFLSQPLIIKNNNLIISTNKAVLSYDSITSRRNWIFHVQTIIKPIITSNYIYLVTKQDLLICLNNSTGKVLWSKNIYSLVQDRKVIKKIGNLYDFKIVNNKINIYSKNGYLLSFNFKNGDLSYLDKISKNGFSSAIFFLNNHMLFINNKYKLIKYN